MSKILNILGFASYRFLYQKKKMHTLNTVNIFVGKILCSSALCSLTAVKDKKMDSFW